MCLVPQFSLTHTQHTLTFTTKRIKGRSEGEQKTLPSETQKEQKNSNFQLIDRQMDQTPTLWFRAEKLSSNDRSSRMLKETTTKERQNDGSPKTTMKMSSFELWQRL